MTKLGGRKLVVSIMVMATGIGITAVKGDIPPNLLQLLEVVLGAFVSGNILAQVFDRPSAPGLRDGIPEAPILQAATTKENVVEPSAVMPIDVAVGAFQELGQLMNLHAVEHKKSMDAMSNAMQGNNQALGALVEKLSRS